jgi:hypothetical protein
MRAWRIRNFKRVSKEEETMATITRRAALALLVAVPAAPRAFCDPADGWISLFDGKSLAGWKPSEHTGTFTVADGQIVVHGDRSHLFYTGPQHDPDFKNFELTADVMTRPGANSGIYFHTAYQPTGFPSAGFEVQIANTHQGANGYVEHKKTGSLYGVRNVSKQLVTDNEWFNMNILVRGKQVQIRVNQMLVVDYIEPTPPFRADPNFQRVLNHGTFALQGHDPRSTTYFKNIRVRPLSDNIAPLSSEQPTVDENYRDIIRLSTDNYPVVDYHVHLKGGLTLDAALDNSRRLGINYGIAINCGLGFPVHSDESVNEYLETMKGKPCYVALQGEGREWMTLASPQSIARFDYVFTDAMTFTDDSGKRMRIWIDEEIGEIKDKQAFMDMYVKRIVGVMREPIDIYANATFLPSQMVAEYNTLWTPARMQSVIEAATANNVAIEINNRYKIPSAAFIKLAKAAQVKFSFGTNNTDANLGRLEYPIQMVKECGLMWQDIFVPKPAGQKPIEVRK